MKDELPLLIIVDLLGEETRLAHESARALENLGIVNRMSALLLATQAPARELARLMEREWNHGAPQDTAEAITAARLMRALAALLEVGGDIDAQGAAIIQAQGAEGGN